LSARASPTWGTGCRSSAETLFWVSSPRPQSSSSRICF
jgi:hypothetical protein